MITIKTDRALKLSLTGRIEYCVMNDDNEILFQMLENFGGRGAGGGTLSSKIITYSSVKSLLDGQSDRVVKTEIFNSFFIGESNNNSGFFAAILRHEGLLAEEGDNHLILHDALETWKYKMLAMCRESDC